MNESVLHAFFEKKLLGNLFTTQCSKPVEILDFGEYNRASGPDFNNVKLRIDNQVWFGSVEFHIRSSDWYRHRHERDSAYNGVLLHFVLQHDRDVYINDCLLPVVELNIQPDSRLHLINSDSSFPCSESLKHLSLEFIKSCHVEAAQKRLIRKSNELRSRRWSISFDKRNALLILLARQFGGVHNKIPLEMVMDHLKPQWLARINYDPFRIEALLFGLAGFLINPHPDSYTNGLQKEFKHLQRMFEIEPVLSPDSWKQSGMRPGSGAQIRLAQLSALLSHGERLFRDSSLCIQQDSYQAMNSYWWSHHMLGKKAKRKSRLPSSGFLAGVRINVLSVILYAGDGTESSLEKIYDDLSTCKPESNILVKKWMKAGVFPDDAMQSQGMIELMNEQCKGKKCLICSIGKELLKS